MLTAKELEFSEKIKSGDIKSLESLLAQTPKLIATIFKHDMSAIQYAAYYGQNNTLEFLVTKGLRLDTKNNKGMTAIHFAAIGGRNNTLEFLVKNGLQLDAKNDNGDTVIHFAAIGGQNHTLEFLEEKGLALNEKNNKGSTAIHFAAQGGQNHTLELLEKKGLTLNEKNNDGSTAIHQASTGCHNHTIEFLIQKNLDLMVVDNFGHNALWYPTGAKKNDTINYLKAKGLQSTPVTSINSNINNNSLIYNNKMLMPKDFLNIIEAGDIKALEPLLFSYPYLIAAQLKHGITAIHIAAAHGHTNIVEFLGRKGLRLDAKDDGGNTAIHYAAEMGHNDTIEFLVKKGLVINEKNKNGSTAIHNAARGGQIHTLEFLVKNGLQLDIKDFNDNTAIHFATTTGKINTIEFLVKNGLQLNAKNSSGGTAIHFAALGGQNNTLEFLVKNGLQLDAKDSSSSTPIHLAACGGHNHTIDLLIHQKLDLKAVDNAGHNALWFATQYKRTDTINYLMAKGLQPTLVTSINSNVKNTYQNMTTSSPGASFNSINNNNNLYGTTAHNQTFPSTSDYNTFVNLAKQIQDLKQRYESLLKSTSEVNQKIVQQTKLIDQQNQLLTKKDLEIAELRSQLELAKQININHTKNSHPLNQEPNYRASTTITDYTPISSLSITHINDEDKISPNITNIKSDPVILNNRDQNTQANPLQVFAQLATIKPEPITPTFAEREINKRSADLLEDGRNKYSRG